MTLADRVCSFIERRGRLLFAAWLLHAFLLHWFVLGFTSWDGLSYRVPPIVELVQHGHFGTEKYDTWIYIGYRPFVELVHYPFLKLFGLRGVLMGFPFVVFPLCIIAIYLCVRELTGDKRAGVLGALAWMAIPLMNSQPFSGYVDFAVCAFLAFVIFSIVRLPRVGRTVSSFACLAIAVAQFTLSRTQAVYIVAMLFPFITYGLFCERSGLRIRMPRWREALFAASAMWVGAIPAIAIQVSKYLRYGSPTYPYQFQVLGVKIGDGYSTLAVFRDGGLKEETVAEFTRATKGAWFWPSTWPLGFFDSRNMGGGFMLVVALLLLAVFLLRASRVERWLVLGCVLVSLIARDFWLPRYAYTLTLSISLIVGRGLMETAKWQRARGVFWVALGAVLLHLARPEFDIAMMPEMGPRLDVAGTTQGIERAAGAIQPYPDVHGHFVIIGYVANGFALPVFGRNLTNEVLHSLKWEALGERCSGVTGADRDPSILFIDDHDKTKDCHRECAISEPSGRCLAYRLHWQ